MEDKILKTLLNKYKKRSEVGIKKYGATLDRKDLTLSEWITHAQEEAMDLTLYLERIKKEIGEELNKSYIKGVQDGRTYK
jgi:hypothetical protein